MLASWAEPICLCPRRQKEAPAEGRGGWDLLIKPGSLAVGNAAIGQGWMSIASDFFAAGVVSLAAVGSAQYKLWARLLELRKSDLCREEQSWQEI